MAHKLPVEGELATCSLCGEGIVWEFDDPDATGDNPYGLWISRLGDVCFATDAEAANFYHAPAGES